MFQMTDKIRQASCRTCNFVDVLDGFANQERLWNLFDLFLVCTAASSEGECCRHRALLASWQSSVEAVLRFEAVTDVSFQLTMQDQCH